MQLEIESKTMPLHITFSTSVVNATTTTSIPSPSCYDGQLQLGNASFEFNSSHYHYQGRVEVCINGTFGAICDVGWDELDAQVACRQLLGFNGKGLMLSHVQLYFLFLKQQIKRCHCSYRITSG